MRTEHPKRAAPATGRTEPFLKLSGIAVAYGGIRAIKGISLEVKQGEIVSMIGANGAGKTTTLKTIMRLLPLASGTIEFAGRLLNDVDTESVVDLGICLVPEGRAIFPNLTVRENLEMGAYNHRDAKTIRESIEDVIQLFPRLGERMTQEGGTLSGGDAPARRALARYRTAARAGHLRRHRPDRGVRHDHFARGTEYAIGPSV